MKTRRLWAACALVVAMGQFGPEYATDMWDIVIDCLIRFIVAFTLTYFAMSEFAKTIREEITK